MDRKDCPVVSERYSLELGSDNMSVTARFIPASETGERITFDEFLKDLRFRNITFGLQMDVLQEHFQSEGVYGTDLVVAKGREPRHGTDARIEYYFNTDVHAQPEMKEDGSVDYFNLNVINHCKAGEVLAKIIPADEGDYGVNVLGTRIKPREVKKVSLKYGNNIELSEDRMSISSMVAGHVVLVEDKVFVSDVYEVENVDNSTGNIDFEGSVQINGNVMSNFVVRAKGNVIINGVVEGAHVYAGGNIIIARGMNGMTKGTLTAGGNVVAKFLENATVEAEGYVNTGSILHSHVTAGTEIVVTGKRGFITGGRVRALQRIEVKTLGAVMGAPTVVEVGASAEQRAEYMQIQKEFTELVQEIKSIQPILVNFAEKRAKGARFNEEQIKMVKEKAQYVEGKKHELAQKNALMKKLQAVINPERKPSVVVKGEVYQGTNIIIGDVSMMVQTTYQYCRFEKVAGDVKMVGL
ncbi:MAG: DUF342 domain-containing protein [Lachnospiraceae bacterium]|nr:DUF342 domain-containing protein [Lachnospiraceae bacterium]